MEPNVPKYCGYLLPTVASHSILTEMQLRGSGTWWFYTFEKDSCLGGVSAQKIIRYTVYLSQQGAVADLSN